MPLLFLFFVWLAGVLNLFSMYFTPIVLTTSMKLIRCTLCLHINCVTDMGVYPNCYRIYINLLCMILPYCLIPYVTFLTSAYMYSLYTYLFRSLLRLNLYGIMFNKIWMYFHRLIESIIRKKFLTSIQMYLLLSSKMTLFQYILSLLCIILGCWNFLDV